MVHARILALISLAALAVAGGKNDGPHHDDHDNDHGHGGPGKGTDKKPKFTGKAFAKSITLRGLLSHEEYASSPSFFIELTTIVRQLWKFAAANGGTRAFGTKGYNSSADYVYNVVSTHPSLSCCTLKSLFDRLKRLD